MFVMLCVKRNKKLLITKKIVVKGLRVEAEVLKVTIPTLA